jgi:hypothetical protein
MKTCRSVHALFAASLLSWILAVAGLAAEPPTQSAGLTFFGWSDQHIPVDGNAVHLIPAIDAMNAMAGRPYPEAIGGIVETPSFVLGCGDITEWPSKPARDAYDRLVSQRLKFPTYDIPGNHDLGGLTPSDTILQWLTQRHGGPRYTFEKGGVTFIGLFSEYDEKLNNPAQPISKEALAYLRAALARVAGRTPVVVATHLCLDAITNKDEFVDAFGPANVILVLGGHYHKAAVATYRGIHFVQLPSPSPKFANAFTVIHITADRLIAVPFNYREGKWTADERLILNTPIKGPARPAAAPVAEAAEKKP